MNKTLPPFVDPIDAVRYDRSKRRVFRNRNGKLRSRLTKKYPKLFDELDMENATSQPKSHFFEWFGAIHFLKTKRWASLIEKYHCKKHKRKLVVFKAVLAKSYPKKKVDEIVRFVSRVKGEKRHPQPPDLFVFSPNKRAWFFCEVKGGQDRLRKRQLDYFAELSRLTGKPIRLLEIR